MALRKKYFIDKKFQLRISAKAVVLPLIIILSFTAVLIFFASKNDLLVNTNSDFTKKIIDNQESIINFFLASPKLQESKNPAVKKVNESFTLSLGLQKKIYQNNKIITKNSRTVVYVLISLIFIQTIVIFALFIFFSHKISGPIYVMSNYLKELREGKKPRFRSLRKNDELIEFYEDFRKTIELITKNK